MSEGTGKARKKEGERGPKRERQHLRQRALKSGSSKDIPLLLNVEKHLVTKLLLLVSSGLGVETDERGMKE